MIGEMEKWKSFRITILLYAILAVLGLGVGIVYVSFEKIAADQKAMRAAGLLVGMTEAKDERAGSDANALKILTTWAARTDTALYTGQNPLEDDLKKVAMCVQGSAANQTNGCSKLTERIFIDISNMVSLRQHSFINTLLFIFALLAVIVLLTIYLVRVYISYQLKKHSVIDMETGLFNKKYYEISKAKIAAISKRHNEDASLVTLDISALQNIAEKKERLKQLKTLGAVMIANVRTGDVVSRTSESQVICVLPETNEERAQVFVSRMKAAINSDALLGAKGDTLPFTVDALHTTD